MEDKILTVPELGSIAVTRALLGAGVGLLVANCLTREQRKVAGLTLITVGAITTIPLALAVFRKREMECRE